MTLDECRQSVGRDVVYCGGIAPEDGVITSVNECYAFVRFLARGARFGGLGSLACRPEDLELKDPA